MPLVGFITKTGEKVSLIEAIQKPEKIKLPFPVIAGIVSTLQYRGDSISATTLTGCLRKNYWERTVPYYADPTALLFKAYRGKIIHEVLEKNNNVAVETPGEDGMKITLAIRKAMSRFIAEQRFYRSVELEGESLMLSGQVDLLENVGKHGFNGAKERVVIHDYKTAEPYAIKMIAKKGLSPEHVFQLNFYAWVTRPLFCVQSLKIHYMLMSGIASSGDVVSVKEFGKVTEVVIPNVPLWTEEEFLAKAMPLIQIMREAFSKETLPPADPGENGWRCKSCPFADRCDAAFKVSPPASSPRCEEVSV